MPVRISNCGRIWLVGSNGAYTSDSLQLTPAEVNTYLKAAEREHKRDAETYKILQEVAKRDQVEVKAKEKEIEAHKGEPKRKLRQADRKLNESAVQIDNIRDCEKACEEREKKAALQLREKESIKEQRVDLLRRAKLEEEMLEILRLEKRCLDQDRAEARQWEKIMEAQLEQDLIALAEDQIELQTRVEEFQVQ